jgi:RNA polymerase sigma-70 factor (ECF subfamily)
VRQLAAFRAGLRRKSERRNAKETISLEALSGASGDRAPREWRDEKAAKPLERLEDHELVETIRKTLEELPENQRAAMLLCRYQELSYRDIGEAIGVSEKAVKSLMARAREQLKRKLLPYLREEVRG